MRSTSWPCFRVEAVTIGVDREHVDQPVVQFGCARQVVAQADVDVLGQAGVVSEPGLKRHSALEYHRPGSAP